MILRVAILYVIMIIMTEKKERKTDVWRTLHYFNRAASKHRAYFIGMLISTPLVIFLRNIMVPWFVAQMIGKLSEGIPSDQFVNVLLPYGVGLVLSYIGASLILGELRLFWTWRGEVKAMYDLSSLCFNTISEQSMQFHSDRFSGSLVSQTNKFVSAFERFFDVLIWSVFPLVVSLLSIIVILYPQAPIFATGVLAFTMIYTMIAGFTFKKVGKLSEVEAEAQNKQTGQLSDSISNIMSVKSYAHESHERRRYANFQNASLRANDNLMQAIIKRDILFTGVNVGITVLLVFIIIDGPMKFGLSIATVVLIANYSQQVMGLLWDISRIFRDMNRIFGDAYAMTEILDTKDDVVDCTGAKKLIVKRGKVDFKGITFRHKDASRAIFNDFSLTVEPGERIGLVGVSGSGKTTLTKLLLRFADVGDGVIEVDGQNIAEVTQKSLRRNIAYVPQETALFHRSIAENIAYGKIDATEAEILKVAKLANVNEFVGEMPEGYETMVGERGVKLSGGQRQRIAIARAMLKDAPILVLDEATSALDSESEELIQEALEKLMKGRTSIVIAHRLSTVSNMDRIVVLADGRIVEQGSHKELLMKDGAYKRLWSKQSGGFLNGK